MAPTCAATSYRGEVKWIDGTEQYTAPGVPYGLPIEPMD